MSLKMSRRGFVKASAVATASTLLLGASATTAAADEAAGATTSSDDVKIIPSACRQCYGRCALFGHVKDGRLVKIEGNPDLFSEGTLCGRCFAIPQELYNPLRVRYPQKRVGEKGSGQWKRISWKRPTKLHATSSPRSARTTAQTRSRTSTAPVMTCCSSRPSTNWWLEWAPRPRSAWATCAGSIVLYQPAPVRRRDAVHRLGR